MLLFNSFGPIIDIFGYLNFDELKTFSNINKFCRMLIKKKLDITYQKKNFKFRKVNDVVLDYCKLQNITVPRTGLLNYSKYLLLIPSKENFMKYNLLINDSLKFISKKEFKYILDEIIRLDRHYRYMCSICLKRNFKFSNNEKVRTIHRCINGNSWNIFRYVFEIFGKYMDIKYSLKHEVNQSNYKFYKYIVENIKRTTNFTFDQYWGSLFRFMSILEIEEFIEKYKEDLKYSYDILLYLIPHKKFSEHLKRISLLMRKNPSHRNILTTITIIINTFGDSPVYIKRLFNLKKINLPIDLDIITLYINNKTKIIQNDKYGDKNLQAIIGLCKLPLHIFKYLFDEKIVIGDCAHTILLKVLNTLYLTNDPKKEYINKYFAK